MKRIKKFAGNYFDRARNKIRDLRKNPSPKNVAVAGFTLTSVLLVPPPFGTIIAAAYLNSGRNNSRRENANYFPDWVEEVHMNNPFAERIYEEYLKR